MKRFVDGIIEALLLMKSYIGRGGGLRHLLHLYGLAAVLGVLALIAGLEVAVALQLISGTLVLSVDVILGGSLFFFLFLGYIKALPRPGYDRPLPEINVADLLGREVVPLQTSEAHAVLKGKVILVTGAAGSIGTELCRQLLSYELELVIALDSNETGLFDLAENLRYHSHAALLYPYIGDIMDRQRMKRLFTEKRPHIVFHAAAYKHVPLLEHFPDQAINTNVLATYYLCCLAQEHEVARFVFISTDKAVAPASAYGASKWMGELIVQALASSATGKTYFCAVRFGNVIGSRGSVVPIFTQQIRNGGPVTITDPDATRYFMTIPEACGLVILTAAIADQGGLYLLNMGDPVRIVDLAIKMIRLHGLRVGRDIPIVYTGLRPGEHLHETLVAVNEELIQTSNSKILRVTRRGNLPTVTTIIPWMQTLEDSLQCESSMQLREHLFEIVREQELIVTS